MNISMLVRARDHFNSQLVPRSVNRHNQRAWIRSIRQLGSQWLLAAPIPRPGTADHPSCLSYTPIRADIAPACARRSGRPAT